MFAAEPQTRRTGSMEGNKMPTPMLERPHVVELIRSGLSTTEIARRMECCPKTIRNAKRKLGLLTPSAPAEIGLLAVAPNPAEERLSQSTLALAPSVAVLAAEVRKNAIAAYMRGEPSPYARKP